MQDRLFTYKLQISKSTARLGISIKHLKVSKLNNCPVSLLGELRYLSLVNVHKN